MRPGDLKEAVRLIKTDVLRLDSLGRVLNNAGATDDERKVRGRDGACLHVCVEAIPTRFRANVWSWILSAALRIDCVHLMLAAFRWISEYDPRTMESSCRHHLLQALKKENSTSMKCISVLCPNTRRRLSPAAKTCVDQALRYDKTARSATYIPTADDCADPAMTIVSDVMRSACHAVEEALDANARKSLSRWSRSVVQDKPYSLPGASHRAKAKEPSRQPTTSETVERLAFVESQPERQTAFESKQAAAKADKQSRRAAAKAAAAKAAAAEAGARQALREQQSPAGLTLDAFIPVVEGELVD